MHFQAQAVAAMGRVTCVPCSGSCAHIMSTETKTNMSSTPAPIIRGDAYLIVDDHALIREGIVRVFTDFRPNAQLFEACNLRQAMQISAEPVFHKIVRWDKAIPQYHLGHLGRVAEAATDFERALILESYPAAEQARAGSSSWATGSPKTAMTASPMNFSTVPP